MKRKKLLLSLIVAGCVAHFPAYAQSDDPVPTALDEVGNITTVVDEVANPSTTDDTVALIFRVSGHVYDHQNKPISGALVSLESDAQTVAEFTTSEDGSFVFEDLSATSYTIITLLNGYVFKPTQVTLSGEEVEIDITSSLEPVAVDNAIIVGKHSCDENTVAMNSANGELIHSFDSGFTAKGIYLRTLYFDKDANTDIAIGEIGQGKDVFIFDANKKQIGAVLTNGDNKGVHVAFGDVDADKDFEIAVTNQSADKQVNLYQSDGKAIRPLVLFDKDTKLNIAIGDVTGDGVAELVVTMAEEVKGENVFVFDQHGTKLSSFALQLPFGAAAFQDIDVEHVTHRRKEDEEKSSALVVTTGDVNGDGTEEIIVGQAGKDKGYGVAMLNAQGDVIKQFYAFTGIQNANGNSEACDKKAYQGYGVVVATGDVDNDGKAEILTARNGGTEVRVYSADGSLLQGFAGATDHQVITGLAFGEKMRVATEEVVEVEPETTLENTRIVGKPEKRAVLDGNTIKGTVQVSNALIVKVNIKAGANLKLGPGVKFKTHKAIPPGISWNKRT